MTLLKGRNFQKNYIKKNYFSGMMTILVGLCVANIKDILKQKEDFKLAKMVTNIQSIGKLIIRKPKKYRTNS